MKKFTSYRKNFYCLLCFIILTYSIFVPQIFSESVSSTSVLNQGKRVGHVTPFSSGF